MKFFSWLLTLLIIALIIAAFTSTSEEKFRKFVYSDRGGDTMSCKPIINGSTQIKVFVKVASIHSVSFCETKNNTVKKLPIRLVNPDGIRDTSSVADLSKIGVAKITRKETWLGLFGRFWKLKSG